jgi:hypothetical protein
MLAWRKFKSIFVVVVSISALLLLTSFSTIRAQIDRQMCSAQMEEALSVVASFCGTLGRNEACYGNPLLEATFRQNVTPVQFTSVGDRANLSLFESISTAAYSAMNNEWGIAVLKAQANLPYALPGQNVTFLIFGVATVDNPTPDMRAVTVRTHLGGMECTDVPGGGLLIQSPNGQRVNLTINGVDIVLGSTIHVTAETNGSMTLTTLEGMAVLT